jgi:hydroxymethylpyrimidine pyrophosphatase-like HAD family hydrolase
MSMVCTVEIMPKQSDLVDPALGTLLDSHHQLSVNNPTYTTIRRIREDYPTLPIVISTGKQYTSTAALRTQLDLSSFHACHLNGNVIYNPDGSILQESGLDVNIVNAVYTEMKKRSISLFLYDYGKVYQVLFGLNDGYRGIWAEKLRGYGEMVVECSELESEEMMRRVNKREIKIIKMAICQDEAMLPGPPSSISNVCSLLLKNPFLSNARRPC